MKLLNESGAEIAEGDAIAYDPLQRGWVVGITVDDVYSEILYTDGNKAFSTFPPPVPAQVTMRQACLELEDAGILDDVEALVATLPRPYQIEWQRASTVDRSNPLVEVVRQQQGMTELEIDALFTRAAVR